ncbi:MAG: outer membrane beta-barrel protein [Saprospiraceae bacterium]|nr:outer membrane beta-barrel protein [Saprospiraceae bacterium]
MRQKVSQSNTQEKAVNPTNLVERFENLEIAQQTTAVYVETNEGVSINKEELPELNQIAYLEMDEMKVQKPAPSVVPGILKSKNTKHFAIEGNAMHALLRPASGTSIYMVADNKLGDNSKFRIEYGLGYSFVQQPLGLKLVFDEYNSNAWAGENIVYYGTYRNAHEVSQASLSADSKLSTTYKQGLNLHYLSSPVRVAYPIGKKMTMRVGVEAGLLLFAKSKFTNDGLINDVVSSKNDGSNSTLDRSLSSAGSLSLFDFSALAGVSYSLNTHWSIMASYKHGLKDILPFNSNRDFNRLFGMGLSYHFTKGG